MAFTIYDLPALRHKKMCDRLQVVADFVDGVALRLCLPAPAGTWGVAIVLAREEFRRPYAPLGAGLVAARPLPPRMGAGPITRRPAIENSDLIISISG
jgi:hypothetical protein